MKNKAMIYLLGLAVAVVWGLIVYRLVSASGGDEDLPQAMAAAPTSREPLNDYAPVKDTARLMLSYRDPFAMTKAQDTAKVIPLHTILSQSAKPSVVNLAAAPVKPAINWGFISYAGYIRNPASKRLLALVHINGKELMLSEGETADQVKLIRNLRDSIKIAYQGKTKFLTLNTTNPSS